jgi:AAT family amino acid transporter/D-serine/D-alanine/glycine transporter
MVVSFVAMLAGVGLNYFIPARAFAYITSIATVCGLFVWAMVMVSHLGYRRAVNDGRLPEGAFRMPVTPGGNWFVLAFLALVLVLLAFNSDTRIALYVTPVWVLALTIGYLASRAHHIRLTPVAVAGATSVRKPKPPAGTGPTVGPTASPV